MQSTCDFIAKVQETMLKTGVVVPAEFFQTEAQIYDLARKVTLAIAKTILEEIERLQQRSLYFCEMCKSSFQVEGRYFDGGPNGGWLGKQAGFQDLCLSCLGKRLREIEEKEKEAVG